MLPEILPLVAHPELAGGAVIREPPRLPHSVRPGLGSGVLDGGDRAALVENWVVLRHGVVPAVVGHVFVGVIDVDPQDFRAERGEILADAVLVGVARAVAAADEHQTIAAESHVAAVVAVGIPLDDHGGRVAVECVRRLAVDHVAGDPRSLAAVLRHAAVGALQAIGADVNEAVLRELRVKRDRVVHGRVVGRDEHLRLVHPLVFPHPHDGGRPVGPGLRHIDQPVAAGLVGHGDRARHRRLRKGPGRRVGQRRLGRTGHLRGRHGHDLRDAVGLGNGGLRSLEHDRPIVLVAMEVPLGERRAGGELGLVAGDVVIVAAEGKPPFVARLGPAAGVHEARPWDLHLDRPAFVAVGPHVERAAELHGRLDPEVVQLLEPAHESPPGDEAVELRVEGVHLQFVIRRLVYRRLQKHLEDVVVPDLAVVLGDVGVEVGVVEVGADIEILAIPEDLRPGGLRGGLVVLAQPRHREVVDRGGVLPGRVVEGPVDRDRVFRELAGVGREQCRRRGGGSGGSLQGIGATATRGDRGQDQTPERE